MVQSLQGNRNARAVYLTDANGAILATIPISGTVDTELPAAAALADATANPTVPSVGSLGMGFNNVGWDRLRTKGTGWQGVALVRGSDGQEILTLVTDNSDAASAVTSAAVRADNHLWQDTANQWNRQRGNSETTVLASASRTTLTNSPDQVNYNGRSLKVYVNISAYTAGGLTPKIQEKEPVSGAYRDVLTGAMMVATGLVCLQVGPHIALAANLVAQEYAPRTWRVVCTPLDATPITYSVSVVTGV